MEVFEIDYFLELALGDSAEGEVLFCDEALSTNAESERRAFRKFFFRSPVARKLVNEFAKENRILVEGTEEGANDREKIRSAIPRHARPEFHPPPVHRLRGLSATLTPRLLPIPVHCSCRI